MNNKPRKILYIQRPTGGGSTISLYELTKGLDTTKYKPIILFFKKNQYVEKFNTAGIKTLTLDISKKRKQSVISKIYQLIADILLSLHIAFILKREKIDLVHMNLGLDRPTMLASILTKTPQICHFRMFSTNIPYTSKKLATFVSAFLYISNVIAKRQNNLGLPLNKGHVIYNPFDKAIFQHIKNDEINSLYEEFGLKKTDVLISNVGRLDSWKGQDYFLKAFAKVLKTHPNTKALIVGDYGKTSQEGILYYEHLQNLTKELNISKHVIFTGHRFDIPQIMVASDIVVHSASKPEPFGRVIVEAMLAETPIIATAAGGVLEIIEDQVNGILIPLENITSMADAMQRIMENPEKSQKMAKLAKKYAQEKFSVQQHVMAVENIYQTVLTK
ncbi:MAG: glycosyltransferase family 4 protein [Cocleimonas sp.]